MLSKDYRSSISGFTLLETMIAFAVVGMVLTATYQASIRILARQVETFREYDRLLMARAILDEYVVTYPLMQTAGEYGETWFWEIRESRHAPLQATDFDSDFDFFKITARVSLLGQTSAFSEQSTIVAREPK